MIRQPDFVTEAIAQEAIQRSSKLPEDLKEQVVFKKDGRRSLCPNLTRRAL